MHGRMQPPPSPRSPNGKPAVLGGTAVDRADLAPCAGHPHFLPMETVPLLRPTLLTVAIRREILSVLARSGAMTVPTATAHVAASWTARRRLRGESPSAVQTAQA